MNRTSFHSFSSFKLFIIHAILLELFRQKFDKKLKLFNLDIEAKINVQLIKFGF